MDIGPGARSAPVVTVLSSDQLMSMRRHRNSISYHASRKDGDSPLSLDRELDDHTHELMVESCVWLSSRPGETPDQILGGNGWVVEKEDELAGLMWHEDEEGGVTASEGTTMDPPSLPSRRSLGDVLGDHCQQDLVASPCEPEGIKPFQRRNTAAATTNKAGKPIPKYTPLRMRAQNAPPPAVVPRHRTTGDTYSSPLAASRRAGSMGASRLQSKPRSQLNDSSSPKSDGGPVPFERQQARAVVPPPSALSSVMLQLSRELAHRTLSGTLGGRSRSPPDARSTLLTNKAEPNKAPLSHTAALRPPTKPWWERLAPKPLVRASSASNRRISLEVAGEMHVAHNCVVEGATFRREASRTLDPVRRSHSHSYMPGHLRRATPPPSQRGFTQAAKSFRNEPSTAGILSPVVSSSVVSQTRDHQSTRSVSAQSSFRRGLSNRDASFLRPTEASQSRKDALAQLPKMNSTVSSHGGGNGASSSSPSTASPPRAVSAGRYSSSQALFQRLYTHRTEASIQHQHRDDPPSPPPKLPAASKAVFVPSCATRKERSHLAKAYNLPEPPPRAVPQVKKYVPMAQRSQAGKGTATSPSRTYAGSPTVSRRRSPAQQQQRQHQDPAAVVSRGQVLYEQTRSAQMARKQEVIASAMSGRRFDAARNSSNNTGAASHHTATAAVESNSVTYLPPSATHHHDDPNRTLSPRHREPPHTAPNRQGSTPVASSNSTDRRSPARCDLDSLFVCTPVYHRSLQENNHRPSPGTPRAQQGVSPYETSFEKPLAPIEGDLSLVSVAMPEVMDVL